MPVARVRQRRRRWSRYSTRTFYLFVSPWLLGFLLLTAVPLAYALAMSFTNFDGLTSRWRWVGLRNYGELLDDSDALASLVRTLAYTAIAVPLSVAGGLALAVLLNRRLKTIGLFRTIFFLPSVVPVVAMAIMWKLIFNKDAGILNAMTEWVGVDPVAWLVDPYAFYALIILTLWGLGGGMVIMLAALQGVPAEMEEAAIVDGANRWHVFRHVTVPMISPVIFFQVVTGIITALQMIMQPLLLARPTGSGRRQGAAEHAPVHGSGLPGVLHQPAVRLRFGDAVDVLLDHSRDHAAGPAVEPALGALRGGQ